MRTLAALLTGFVLAALAFSNPGPEDFEAFLRTRAEGYLRQETGEGTLGEAIARLGGGLVGRLGGAAAERDDYVLFSLYTVDPGAEGPPRWRFLGIAGRFVVLETPEDAEEDAPAP
ncbi:MAG: DUF4359 domain-containing protein [Bacteroidetes bacterium]|nr:MAG: DUF4359 domain-containing protein [Bacteroidota bacterium]